MGRRCAGAKLQERSSGESFNFDIARFAKIAEESRARAEQEAEAAPGSPDAKPQPVKPAKDWNAQVRSASRVSCARGLYWVPPSEACLQPKSS